MEDNISIEKELYKIFDEANLLVVTENGDIVLEHDIDSIQFISLIIEIEDKFNIEIPDEYLVANFMDDFKHVADVVVSTIKLLPEEVMSDKDS